MTPTTISILEDRTNAIWSYVRQHANSLDSERATKMIRDLVQSAVFDVNELLVAETAKVVELRKKIGAMKLAIAVERKNLQDAAAMTATATERHDAASHGQAAARATD